MMNWVAISRSKNSNSRWLPRDGFEFAVKEQSLEVAISELRRLLPHYVFGFTNSRAGQTRMVAILGFRGARNLFVDYTGRWLCPIVPRILDLYPFTTQLSEKNEKVFCISQEHLTEEEENGKPLFEENGELQSEVQDRLELLNRLDTEFQQTRMACQQLFDKDLLEPWEITVADEDRKKTIPLHGLFRVNESRLGQLDGETLKQLQDSGALVMAYIQNLSINQLSQLKVRDTYLSKQLDTINKNRDELSDILHDGGSISFESFRDSESE